MTNQTYPANWVKYDNEDIKFVRQLGPGTYHIIAPFGPLPDKNGTFMVKEAAINTDLIPEETRRKILREAECSVDPEQAPEEFNGWLALQVFDEMWEYPETKQFASYMEVVAYLSKRTAKDDGLITIPPFLKSPSSYRILKQKA